MLYQGSKGAGGKPAIQQARRPKARRVIRLAAAVLIGGAGVVTLLSNHAQLAILEVEQRVIAAEPTAPITSTSRLRKKELDKDITTLVTGLPGARVGVALYDFTVDKAFYYGDQDAFVAASVPKLLTAALWLHEVDEGKRSLTELVGGTPAQELLRRLIELSDNTAWEVLDGELGKSNLEAYAQKIGMREYDFDANALSVPDTLLLLIKLYEGNLLKPDSRLQLLEYMKNANYRHYIIAALPEEGVTAYHKVGYLEDRVLDSAIVENGRLTYALVTFVEARSAAFNLVAAGQFIRDVTGVVQQRYER